MERGVIAPPAIIHPIPQGLKMERGISSQELRYYVMYWDRVVIPNNNLIGFGIPEEDELIQSGAVERPRVNFIGAYGGDQLTEAVLSCQTEVAEELLKDKTKDWVIHQFSSECALLDKVIKEQETIRVDLANVLPVPDANVPINEVLEFKERRKDELGALHQELDALYKEALQAPDTDLETRKVVSDLSQRIRDLDRVSNERFPGNRKFDLAVELNVNGMNITKGVAYGSAIDFFATAYTIPIATVVGGLASTITVTARATKTFEPAKENDKLAYLGSAMNAGLLNQTNSKTV
ncbi:DUF6236 family protein [Aquisalimonas lutea]|uniref:DUF6236 family protein n=1 Tax=Aquisalimonas lutea TaxID=1327750 RepID=UPI0025B58473|nr:DUF6236 family protein [Aquisalimonas lutea]MDN3518156.1 DUF6236 family protein [Aquisalimonas lutea]